MRGPLLLLALACAITSPGQAVLRGEYYIDTDPGFGQGMAIELDDAQEVSVQLSVDVSGLAPGPHVIGLRTIDDQGHWSLTGRRLFMVQGMAPGGDITGIEYFIDADPGFGQATPWPTTAAPEINAVLPVALSDTLATGAHLVGIRSRSQDGAWSLTHALPFEVVVGVEELSRWGITAGPNPMREELLLQRMATGTPIEILLLDARGALLFSTQWVNERTTLTTAPLAAGNYLLMLRMPDHAPVVLKVVKK